MSRDLTEKTISFILSSHRDGKLVYIEWFGGEPLLATEQIDRISHALQERHIEVIGGMVSNGSLVTDRIIEKMKTAWNIRSIQISMDGTEEQYIRRKQYYRYENEYRHVLENIARLAANGIFVNIRVNVDEGNVEDIPAFIQDLDEHFLIKRISPSTLFRSKRSVTAKLAGKSGSLVFRQKRNWRKSDLFCRKRIWFCLQRSIIA